MPIYTPSGGSSDPQEILNTISGNQGDILYRNASDWVSLAPGTAGFVLYTDGANNNPYWNSTFDGVFSSLTSLPTSLSGYGITDAISTADTGTVTNTMLAGSIANDKLANSSFALGSTTITLGGTTSTINGLTLGSSIALGTPASGTLTNCTGLPISGIASLGTGVGAALAQATDGASGLLTYGIIGTSGAKLPFLNTANTWSAAQINSTSGASSTPALKFTGTLFTGGTGTTTMPHVLIEPSGATAATGWSTSGTLLGLNSPSGFSGNIQEWRANGSSVAYLSSGGALVALNLSSTNSVTGANLALSSVSGVLTWGGESQLARYGTASWKWNYDQNSSSITNVIHKAASGITGSNLNGASFIIEAGDTTGTGTSGICFKVPSYNSSSGTTANTATTVANFNGYRTSGTAVTIQPQFVIENTKGPYAVTGNSGTNVLTSSGHTFAVGDFVYFTALTGGSSLSTTSGYYIKTINSPSSGDFTISATSGGATQALGSNITAGYIRTTGSYSTSISTGLAVNGPSGIIGANSYDYANFQLNGTAGIRVKYLNPYNMISIYSPANSELAFGNIYGVLGIGLGSTCTGISLYSSASIAENVLTFIGSNGVQNYGALVITDTNNLLRFGKSSNYGTAFTLTGPQGYSTANTAGGDFNIIGGAALNSGQPGNIMLGVYLTGAASSTTVQAAYSTRTFTSGKETTLTSNSATSIAKILLGKSKSASVILNLAVRADDGADFQMNNVEASFSAVNKNDTLTLSSVTHVAKGLSASAGTLDTDGGGTPTYPTVTAEEDTISYTVTMSASTDFVTLSFANAGGNKVCPLRDGDIVTFTTTGTLPTNVSAGTQYYLKDVNTGQTGSAILTTGAWNAKLSTSFGGSNIDMTTSDGSGTITMTAKCINVKVQATSSLTETTLAAAWSARIQSNGTATVIPQ